MQSTLVSSRASSSLVWPTSKQLHQRSTLQEACRFRVIFPPHYHTDHPSIQAVLMWLAGEAAASSTNPTQCSDSAAPDFNGKVAVIDRGSCPFADKICRAQLQGAVAAIVVNNVDGGVFTMGGYSGYADCVW